MTESTAKPAIVHRDIDFGIDDSLPKHWLDNCAHTTHFMNALSTTFPEGERFFIRSVHHYAQHVKDPVLREEVKAFTQQEAMHGREHQALNDVLARQGYPVRKIERWEKRDIGLVEKHAPPYVQLAVTACLEHYTALMAEVLLTSDDLIRKADPRMQKMWRWHAIEESEHKAVAFDVLQKVTKGGFKDWLLRANVMLHVTWNFWAHIFVFHTLFIKADKQMWSLKGWAKVWWFLWVYPGPIRRIIPGWLAWFKPNFHPWERDTRPLLDKHLPDFDERASVRLQSQIG